MAKAGKVTDTFRIIANLEAASRISEPFSKQKGNTRAKHAGILYEKNVGDQFSKLKFDKWFGTVEHNPWFEYTDEFGSGICSPDYIIQVGNGVIIVEVKLTWVSIAKQKLELLYAPVVMQALDCPVSCLIVVKKLTPEVSEYSTTVKDALESESKVLYWPKIGQIRWE